MEQKHSSMQVVLIIYPFEKYFFAAAVFKSLGDFSFQTE